MFLGFVTRVCEIALARSRSLDVRHRDRDFDFPDVHGVLRLAELLHAASHDLGLLLLVFAPFFVDSLLVSLEFQEKRDIGRLSRTSDALDAGMRNVNDCWRVKRSVVEKNLDAI